MRLQHPEAQTLILEDELWLPFSNGVRHAIELGTWGDELTLNTGPGYL